MSTIPESAPGPILGKREDTDPCRSQFAGLGESKHGPEATKDEEASGVEKEDIEDGEDYFIFDEMRRRVREEMKQKKANGGVVVDLFEYFQRCNVLFDMMEEAEANGGGGEKKEERVVEEEFDCTICEHRGHAHYGCPWLKKLPAGGVPPIPSRWMVECTYCHGQNFDIEGVCAGCDKDTKKVVPKICKICWRTGHLDNKDEDCLNFGLEDTPENDPFRELYES